MYMEMGVYRHQWSMTTRLINLISQTNFYWQMDLEKFWVFNAIIYVIELFFRNSKLGVWPPDLPDLVK